MADILMNFILVAIVGVIGAIALGFLIACIRFKK